MRHVLENTSQVEEIGEGCFARELWVEEQRFLWGCGQGNGAAVGRAKVCKQVMQMKCTGARNPFSLSGE